MSVLALITREEDAGLVAGWAREFAAARKTSLIVLCWSYDATGDLRELSGEEESPGEDEFVTAVRRIVMPGTSQEEEADQLAPESQIEIRRVFSPDAVVTTLEQARREEVHLLVAAAEDQTGQGGATYTTNPLLRQSPYHTIILFRAAQRVRRHPRILVGVSGKPHEGVAVSLAARMADICRSRVTMAWVEEDSGDDAIELGRRELQQLLRDVGVKRHDRIRRRVFLLDDVAEIIEMAEKHDLLLIGANNQRVVQELFAATKNPTIAIIKRSPPLRRRGQARSTGWSTRMSPSDYADLIQGLRRGSRLSADFLIMLGLAAAIATLGLLQDSPAVVIGSMLLAPLMTPMIGTGLALAQANPKLGRSAMLSVFLGFLLTLTISFLVAWITPGEEMTSQVVARGAPNILDLLIAVFSAAAASYALARPSLVGAVAGVAIATALVPPLCSVGISVAYRNYGNAEGATLLFVTNLVAIILGAAVTFRLLGVTAARANARQRRWVFRMVAALGLIVIALAYPLEQALMESIDQGKPQPSNYPLTAAVEDALAEYVKDTPGIDIVATGRPSSLHAEADVVVILASASPIDELHAKNLTAIVRREMEEESLVVRIHCLQEAWDEPETTSPSVLFERFVESIFRPLLEEEVDPIEVTDGIADE